jgi:hypothetical protein
MANLVEIDGKQVVIVEKEIPVADMDRDIQIRQTQINNIDRNILGLQQRRAKLLTELQQFKDIKDSLSPVKPPVVTK